MRAGETDKSISVKSAKILSEILKVGKISGIRGPVDVDVLYLTEERFLLMK